MNTTFRIEYKTKWGENLALVLADKKYPMKWNEGSIWSLSLNLPDKTLLKDYTYIVICDGLISRTEWKHHSVDLDAGRKSLVLEDEWIDCPIQGCPFPREHQSAKFDIPGFRGAGTAIPVFSLRSSSDFGIGEFKDLRPLVDWAASTGQCIIQLLPVNDTTRQGDWKDSYPYNPISSFALHPLYIHLQDLGIKETAAFKRQQAELNALPELDYPRVFKAKMALIRKAWLKRGAQDMEDASYKAFYRENAPVWLKEYADFCARRDSLEPEYYCWMQWHLDKQLGEVADYARSKGVSLKGDLPIGVSADSADAYWHPELFNLDSTAGAPPDFFSADGQNWGFPTYNWDEMAKDDYAWWKSRLRKMSRWFDAFRIDHILGFFRIWEIPVEFKSGMYGHFNPALPYSREEIEGKGLPIEGLFHEDPRHTGMYQPLISPKSSSLPEWQQKVFGEMYNDFFFKRHNDFWRRNALKKLPELLGATGMLACGEDLGMVPDCVSGVMEDQKILSLEMSCMEKGRHWPYLSVCATSSHDMATLRMQFAERHSGVDMLPEQALQTLWEHLSSASMLAIFPLQDWLAVDRQVRRKDFRNERINDPGNPDHHWRYRFHLNIEELSGFRELNDSILNLLKATNRA